MLFDHSLFNGHPRFFGYITSSPAPIGMFARLSRGRAESERRRVALAPMATEIEAQTVRWIAELIGFPRRLRRPAGQRRQHGELRLLSRCARRQGAVECPPRRTVGGPAAGCSSTRRRKRTPGFRRRRTSSASAPTPSAGSPPTRGSRWISHALRRAIAQDPATVTFRSSSSARRARSAPARSIRCRRSRRFAASMRCGFTSMAHTARSRRRFPARRRELAGVARRGFGRGRSAQVALRAARSRVRARPLRRAPA